MCTSSGRYFSNASRSGVLTEVWPPTIAPTLVAKGEIVWDSTVAEQKERTWSVIGHYFVHELSLDSVHYPISSPRDGMSIP